MFPILFRIPLPGIGPVTIHTYGVLLVAAFLVAITVARRLARREEIDTDRIVDLGVYAILGGLVGAKLLLLVVDRDFYSRQFANIMADGGGNVGAALSGLGSAGAFIGTLVEIGAQPATGRRCVLRRTDRGCPRGALVHAPHRHAGLALRRRGRAGQSRWRTPSDAWAASRPGAATAFRPNCPGA